MEFHASSAGHGGHHMPSHDMPMGDMPMCSMNMLWNSQVADVCVVFPSWHIRGWKTMLLSCLAIIIISVSYASLLRSIRVYDRRLALTSSSSGTSGLVTPVGRRRSPSPELPIGTAGGGGGGAGYQAIDTASQGGLRSGSGRIRLGMTTRVIRAGMYALSVAISFWLTSRLMLVAMTYNTYLFASIVVGAFIGHMVYEGEMDTTSILQGAVGKGLACH